MSEALYTRDILRLAVSIPHQHRLPNPDGTAVQRSRTCGSRVTADVTLAEDGRIAELGIEVQACALGQAAAAILAKEAVGQSSDRITAARQQLADFLDGHAADPGDWDNMQLLKPAREHKGRHAAILLPYDAILAACADAAEKTEAA